MKISFNRLQALNIACRKAFYEFPYYICITETGEFTVETPVALSLGGNQGKVAETFKWAMTELDKAGLSGIKVSANYATGPVGCVPGTPDFINAAAIGIWNGSPQELLKVCKNLEARAGRPNDHPRYASRTLDLDILFFGNMVCRGLELTLPHPEVLKRRFVLVPLAEIVPEWNVPGTSITVRQALDAIDSTEPEPRKLE